ARNFGVVPVFTTTVVNASAVLTLTSVRRVGVSAPVPATEINITAATPMRAFGMLISRLLIICSLWTFEHHPVASCAGLWRDAEHHHVGTDLDQPALCERIAGLEDVADAIGGLDQRVRRAAALDHAGEPCGLNSGFRGSRPCLERLERIAAPL